MSGEIFYAQRVVCSQFKRWQKEVRMITPEDKVNKIRDRKTTERTQVCVIEIKQTSYTAVK